MREYLRIPKESLLGELTLAAGDGEVGAVRPNSAVRAFGSEEPLRSGIWVSEPGAWDVAVKLAPEISYVLAGRARVTDSASGVTYEVQAGDVLIQPTGWTGRWEVLDTVTSRRVV